MSALKELLVRAEKWPAEAQQELLDAAQTIEFAQSESGFDLDEDDYTIISQRLSENAAGKIASDEEVAAVFAKYRAQ